MLCRALRQIEIAADVSEPESPPLEKQVGFRSASRPGELVRPLSQIDPSGFAPAAAISSLASDTHFRVVSQITSMSCFSPGIPMRAYC
jgi:hypothetical protein